MESRLGQSGRTAREGGGAGEAGEVGEMAICRPVGECVVRSGGWR
jgi:hypothetical protein